ncbi:DegT/DnrJ/EryC1/StrS family aminotransferase [Actinomadura kijaniata]|uniref:dTDP-4-amino-4,6-dideoxygalactose transaminase n=1 Tax=Actinomadura namibiensis TaxID=182080 RepID=A0A7W3LI18_ACTNM|nr:DegT/DnrJ/EryC1/StrS family aminotransferase [Actinomadura namibiensis]MBA8948559.1 dTDP-4-amino-4,6-dideoxygalactose transaminase [Actinomadura namibiensis]
MNPGATGTRTVPLTSVEVGEDAERLVLEVMRSGMLAQGTMVARLEDAFAQVIGVEHVVAVSNGTVALTAALRAAGIGPGDEVITTAFSFNATLNAILEVGAVARFADIGPDCTIDPDSAAALVNPRTAALMPVHLYGAPADMTALTELARRHGLAVIEDAAQAHGACHRGRAVGSFGVGAFSLYGTKNITCGEGGLVTTDDAALADRLRLLRNQGMRRRYEYEAVGYNWRLTDLQAAVAVPQVDRIATILERRTAHARTLNRALADVPGLVLPTEPHDGVHAWHQYTVRVTAEAGVGRDELGARLTEAGVGHGVYYPRLMYDHECYRQHPGVRPDPAPHAAAACAQVLSLPVHPGLDERDLDQVGMSVRRALGA